MKLSGLNHPKTMHFAALLGVKMPTAIGHLELLWAWTGEIVPQGNVGKWPDGVIATACQWDGDPAKFVEALVLARLLDSDPAYRLLVHDWQEHAQSWVRVKLGKLKLPILTAQKVRDAGATSSEKVTSADRTSSAEVEVADRSNCEKVATTRARVPSHATPRQANNPPNPPQGGLNGHAPGGRGKGEARIRKDQSRIAWTTAEVARKADRFSSLQTDHPLIAEAVRLIGGFHAIGMTQTDRMPQMRSRFREVYEQLLERNNTTASAAREPVP